MKIKKRGLAIILSTVVLLSLFLPQTAISIEAAKKVKKPAKVQNLQIERTAKTSLKLTWDKSEGAKGYEIAMSTNDGSFKPKATIEYYSAAEPPVRCGVSHLSGPAEPPFLLL